MKKNVFIVAIITIVAMALTSCSKDVEKCWKVDITMEFDLMTTSVTNYVWATANEIELDIEELKREYAEYPEVKMTIKKSATKIKTEEDCDDKNDPEYF